MSASEADENSPPGNGSPSEEDFCFSPPLARSVPFLGNGDGQVAATPLSRLAADNNKRAKVTELARVFSVIGNIKGGGAGQQGQALTERAAAIRRRFSAMSSKIEVQPIGSAPLRAVSQRGTISAQPSFKVIDRLAQHALLQCSGGVASGAEAFVPLSSSRSCRRRRPRPHRRLTC